MKKRSSGANAIAIRSGLSFARLFGEISPKMRTTTVSTMVDTGTPLSPIHRVKSTVAIEATDRFTILLPIKMVERSLS